MEKRVIKRHQTKRKMFVSYIIIPIMLLTVISGLFSLLYYNMSRDSMIEFENTIAKNVDSELKKVMDNLITSAAQYAMTPWVKRLKYMQKSPELMSKLFPLRTYLIMRVQFPYRKSMTVSWNLFLFITAWGNLESAVREG